MKSAPVLFSALGALTLASCAPSDDESKDRAPSPIPAFELAKAKETDSPEVEATVVDLTVEQLRAKIDSGDLRLIDVRTDEEVAQGVIPGAEHIALDRFNPAVLDFEDEREVVLYCRSGRRSAIAAEELAAQTGEPVQHLAAGILAWQEAGEPVETP